MFHFIDEEMVSEAVKLFPRSPTYHHTVLNTGVTMQIRCSTVFRIPTLLSVLRWETIASESSYK